MPDTEPSALRSHLSACKPLHRCYHSGIFTQEETEAWAEDASGKPDDEGVEPGLSGLLTSTQWRLH